MTRDLMIERIKEMGGTVTEQMGDNEINFVFHHLLSADTARPRVKIKRQLMHLKIPYDPDQTTKHLRGLLTEQLNLFE